MDNTTIIIRVSSLLIINQPYYFLVLNLINYFFFFLYSIEINPDDDEQLKQNETKFHFIVTNADHPYCNLTKQSDRIDLSESNISKRTVRKRRNINNNGSQADSRNNKINSKRKEQKTNDFSNNNQTNITTTTTTATATIVPIKVDLSFNNNNLNCDSTKIIFINNNDFKSNATIAGQQSAALQLIESNHIFNNNNQLNINQIRTEMSTMIQRDNAVQFLTDKDNNNKILFNQQKSMIGLMKVPVNNNTNIQLNSMARSNTIVDHHHQTHQNHQTLMGTLPPIQSIFNDHYSLTDSTNSLNSFEENESNSLTSIIKNNYIDYCNSGKQCVSGVHY